MARCRERLIAPLSTKALAQLVGYNGVPWLGQKANASDEIHIEGPDDDKAG
jgi:hypothetical protein